MENTIKMTCGDLTTIEVMKTRDDGVFPTRAHESDAGLDLYAVDTATLMPSQGVIIPTGIAINIPKGFVGVVADRSSLAKRGLKVAGGIIDSGYTGQIEVIIWNFSKESRAILKGEKMAQILIMPIATPRVVEVLVLPGSTRGNNGFGSSGK